MEPIHIAVPVPANFEAVQLDDRTVSVNERAAEMYAVAAASAPDGLSKLGFLHAAAMHHSAAIRDRKQFEERCARERVPANRFAVMR